MTTLTKFLHKLTYDTKIVIILDNTKNEYIAETIPKKYYHLPISKISVIDNKLVVNMYWG